MKLRKLVLPVLAAVMMAFVGCTPEPAAIIDTYYVTVEPGEWSKNADMGYYFHETQLPAITNHVIDNGAVFCYYIDNYGYDNLMPYVYPYTDDNGDLFWQNIRYDLTTGQITFIIQESDMYTGGAVNSRMKFKVNVMYNRQ